MEKTEDPEKYLPDPLEATLLPADTQKVSDNCREVGETSMLTYFRITQPVPVGGAIQNTWIRVLLRGVLSVTATGQLLINWVSSSSMICEDQRKINTLKCSTLVFANDSGDSELTLYLLTCHFALTTFDPQAPE